MSELDKIRIMFKLKEVNRYSPVGNRHESSAEHSWGCILLAQYFLKKTKLKINELNVLKMLSYHDMVEIVSGDVHLLEKDNRKIPESEGAKILRTMLPDAINDEYYNYYIEFEEGKTIEAKFAKAIDKLESVLHIMDYKENWIKERWTEQMLRDHKEKYFESIPEIHAFFNELVEYLKNENYLQKENEDEKL
jgi:putative hydrolase of HD superfamily